MRHARRSFVFLLTLAGLALATAVVAPAWADTATTTTVTSSANPSVWGQPVTFTATVSSTPAASGGMVTFKDGTTTIGSPVGLTNGTASITTAALAVGNHSITAVYSGATGFTGSTSAALSQRVNRAATTTTTTSSKNPATKGDSITFTATVAVVAPGAGTPTGSVLFTDETNSRTLGSAPLSGNVATFTTTLGVGAYRIAGTYSGDSNFQGSRGAITQRVNPPALEITSPAGGENWASGSTHNITWTYTDSPGTTVKIALFKGSNKVGDITTSAPIGTNGAGSFSWAIPANLLKPGDNYRVDVSVVQKPGVGDRSKAFTIS